MKADINVTPLIDVLLVLLIIFILVAPVAPRSLGTSLLHAPNGGGARGPATLMLEVRAEEYALSTSPVLTLEDLDLRLRAAFETRPDRTLLVKAKGEIPYDRVVAALDVAEGAGAARIGLVEAGDSLERAGRSFRPEHP